MQNLEPEPMLFELLEIESIEDAGWVDCYDITCAGDHSFILGNGYVSHNSALGGLMPVLGREDVGYYTLKGKPLNAYSQSHKKFTENKELSGLFQVVTNGVETHDMADAEFYKIQTPEGEVIANFNDEILTGGKWVRVRDIIKTSSIEDF